MNVPEIKRILYIGWIGRNNVGDEVLWEVFKNLSKEHSSSEKKIEVIPCYGKKQLYQPYPNYYDMAVLGGGSLLSSKLYLNYLLELQKQGVPTVVWGTGIDYINYNALPLPTRKRKKPLRFHKTFPRKELKQVLEDTKMIGVRGPITRNSLLRFGIKPPIQLIGDPGLSCTWEKDEDILKKEGIKPSSKMIAVNWGTAYQKIYGKNEEHVFKSLVNVLRQLAKQGHHLVLYGMWNQDLPEVEKLYKSLKGIGQVDWIKSIYSASSIVSFLRQMNFTINFKLHANVLSACAETPFISLAYRSKCFDFAHSMNMSHYCISTHHLALEQKLMGKVKAVVTNRNSIVQILRKQNKKYQRVQKNYFNKLIQLL
jgi:hypothetical protein